MADPAHAHGMDASWMGSPFGVYLLMQPEIPEEES